MAIAQRLQGNCAEIAEILRSDFTAIVQRLQSEYKATAQ
jgi:hypothetical protein